MSTTPNPYHPTYQSNAELVQHSSLFTPQKYAVGESATKIVFCYVGWNLANITIINGDSGLIIVDTGEDIPQMQAVWEQFYNDPDHINFRDKKVAAVILTHHHADHVGGTMYLVQNKLFVDNDNPVIVGASNLNSEYQQENGLINPLMSCRAMAQYNALLPPDEVKDMNSGIGPIIHSAENGYIPPNKLLSIDTKEKQCYPIGGVDFEFVYVPSEANSEIAAYIRKELVLLSAEVIQDHTFPNLYTLRGASFRDPENWSNAIDTFITLFGDARHMVLQHGPPVVNDCDLSRFTGTDANPTPADGYTIKEILTRYRDAIQYARDQTLRWAMKGYAKEEIMHLVHLPQEQADFKPWLQPFYGNIKHCVPAVYTGYIGWFDGDPIALNPVPRSIYSNRMVQLIGGSEGRMGVLKVAIAAYEKGNRLSMEKGKGVEAIEEWQFAAELATLIIREQPIVNTVKPTDTKHSQGCSHGIPPHLLHATEGDSMWWQARFLKAAAFRQLAYREITANWRGTYLTAAHELEGDPLLQINTSGMKAASIAYTPYTLVSGSLDALAIRLKAEIAEKFHQIIALSVSNLVPATAPPYYRMEIRNCVLKVDSSTTPFTDAAVTISSNQGNINLLLAGDVDGGFNAVLENTYPGLTSPPLTFSPSDGGLAIAKEFFSYFEVGRYSSPPNIYLH